MHLQPNHGLWHESSPFPAKFDEKKMKTDWPVFLDWLCSKKDDVTVEYESVEFPELHVAFNEEKGTWVATFQKAYASGRWSDELDVMPTLENMMEWAEEQA